MFQKIIAFSLLSLSLLFPSASQGAMSSASYSIYADVIGPNGAGFTTSTSYSLSDTPGEAVAGTVTSTSYELRGGFQAAEQDESLSISLSNSSLDLGSFSKTQASVGTASTVMTVTCNAATGYSVSMSGVSGIMPSAVGDGTVTAGDEEYGFTASGGDSAIASDVSVIAGRLVASASSPVYQSQTTLTFKASISQSSVAGTYSQAVTLTASANF